MRVALFTDTFVPQVNGVAFTLERLTRHLELRDIPYEVYAPQSYTPPHTAGPVHRFGSLPLPLYPECRLALPNQLAIGKRLRSFRPDLLHLATPFSMGLSGLYYGKKLDLPLVASYHTHFDSYLRYYKLAFAERWIWQYLRWFHDTCRTTFVPSEETRDRLRLHGIRGVELWKRGVDCTLFHPDKRSGRVRDMLGIREPFIILYAGRLAPEKGLDLLPEAIAMLPGELRQRIHWLIVGEGPMEAKLRQQMPANTTFTGFQSGEALAELYASSDLLAFPSATETFGNVVLESLASGTPALCVQSGGVGEIVTDRVTGRLCAPRDAKAFAAAIREIVEEPRVLNAWAVIGRRYALSQSWEAIFERLLEGYERALSDKSEPIQANRVSLAHKKV
jgi:glycosyltransferase involved in cell wall biosynthesis